MLDRDYASSELQRELNVRVRCYPRWVTEGRLTAVDAKDRLERLKAALHYVSEADYTAWLSSLTQAGGSSS